MKNKFIKFILSFILTFSIMSFTANPEKKIVKTQNSTIAWKAYKVTGFHEGPVQLKEGFFTFEDDKLIGGEFIIDMNTIDATDVKGLIKKKLVNHLKSDDFFNVKDHPTSKLVITNVEASESGTYKVTADVTITGTTHPSTFDMVINGNKASATLKIDRTKYGLKYRSGSFFDDLGNKLIYDEFDVVVNLEF